MTETGDQTHEGEKKEGLIARKFREAREKRIRDSEDVGKIYEAMKNPGLKDVYAKWVNDWDVLANAMSLGREKPRLRTLLTKAFARVSGAAVATVVVPTDFLMDAIGWIPRKLFPIVGYFAPTKWLSKLSMRASESIKVAGLAAGGAYEVGNVGKKVGEVPFAVAGGVVNSAVSGFPEVRAPLVAMKNKVVRIANGILHPNAA